jgi:hypothetical protein
VGAHLTLAQAMNATRYLSSAILLVVGAISLLWGVSELYCALSVDELERIGLENAHGDGNGPELFALRFVGTGLLALIVGWFDWRWANKKRTASLGSVPAERQ